jgi:hypothetical protein
MSTLHPQFTARMEGSPETISDLIVVVPNHGRWLPGSEAFGGTTEVSRYPVHVGTNYLGAGPAGHIRYTFEQVERATDVIRVLDLTIQIPGLLKVAEPLVVSAFRKENVRILAELKRYVEAQPGQRDRKTIRTPGAP